MGKMSTPAVEPSEMTEQMVGTPAEGSQRVGINFSDKLMSIFNGKDGKEYASILIPPVGNEPWATFVIPAQFVKDDKNGHGKYAYISADAKFTVRIDKEVGVDKDGEKQYETITEKMTGTEIKARFDQSRELYREQTPQKDYVSIFIPNGLLCDPQETKDGKSRTSIKIPSIDGGPWKYFSVYTNQIQQNDTGKSSYVRLPKDLELSVTHIEMKEDGSRGSLQRETMTVEQIKGLMDQAREHMQAKEPKAQEHSTYASREMEKASRPKQRTKKKNKEQDR